MGKATEDGGSSDYFKTLFGNIAKGGLSLFSNKNPFYRKRDEGLKQGSDGVDGAFEQGKRKNKAESGDTLDQIKKKLKESGSSKNTGQERSRTVVGGDDAENLDIGTKKKKTYGGNDEAIGKKKKNTASGNGEVVTANNNSTGKKKEKLKDDENSRNLELGKVKTEVIGEKDENLDIRTLKNKSNSENGEDLDIKKARKKVVSGNEQASAAKKKKQVKGDGNSNKLGQEKTETEIASQNDENLDLRIKTKKAHTGTSIVDHADKKKKKKCKEKLNEEGLNEEGNSGSLEDDWAKESVKAQMENDKTKKKRSKQKLNKEGSDGKGNVGSSDDDRPKLSFKIQEEDGKHGLLERKRKENMLEDLARKEKRTKVALEENWQSALKVQEMPRERHLKRQLEQANNEPNKRIKVRHHHFEEVEGGARMGSTVVTESKEKALTEFKGKSVLQKRKWDAFEEEYDVRHGLGDGEHTSKEVVIPEKITGKRKRGEDALDMVVNKQDRDDSDKLERTVFVGNLPLGFKRKNLIREFSQFGEVESLRLRSVPIVDTKLPRKGAILKGKVNDSINSVHAYIVFKDAQSVNAALSRNMTEFSGNHIRVDRAHPPRSKDLNFTSFTKEMVLEMCILSGCDYLQSLQGMGLKRAHGLIKRFKSHEKIIKHLRYSGISVPPLYEETFRKAMLTFRHQRVYDPVIEDIVHLMELTCNLDSDLDFIGPPIPQDLARAIARGEVDPITHERFQDETSTVKNLGQANYSTNGLLKEKQKRALELPVQKNILTNYFCLTSTEAKRQFKAPRTMVGGHEQSEELPLAGEGNSFPNIKTSDFESMLQGSTATLKRSLSGLFDDKPIFSKSCLSNHLGSDSKERGNIGSAYECEAIFGKDEDIRRDDDSKPLVPSRKIVGSRQTSNVPAEKVGTGVKKGTIIRSRYFCTEITDIDLEKAVTEVLPSKEDVSEMTWDMEMVQKTIDARHCSEEVSDNSRNVGIKQKLQQDSTITNNRKGKPQQDSTITNSRKGNGLHDAIASGEGKHVPIFRSDLISSSVQQEKFACNISHIEQYSYIAEQSMERIASTISSFKYTTGRARASGLRAPSKSATTSKSVGDLNQTSNLQVDFSKFAYKSNKSRNQHVSQT